LLIASGLEYQEMRPFIFNGDDTLTTYFPNQRQLTLENTNIIDPPGTFFQYNKYHPQLLGMILERATVSEYMQRALWEPLGMEYDGGWSLDSEQSGFEKMEAGLNGRAIDFAKFGQLFLNHGNWDGVQVISPEWVAESTQLDTALYVEAYYPNEFGQIIYDSRLGYYQYMWYGLFHEDGSYDFFAEGDRGQLIYVAPGIDLVIARFGENFGIPGDIFA
jgi:CubicO group peptidase (beta-lactamase class C family)